RLSRLRVAVRLLGVRERPQLVERVQVRAGEAERHSLVESRAQADVAVRKREHRLALGEHVEVEMRLPHGPRLDGERRMRDHVSPSKSVSLATTMSAPCARSASAWPTRSTPTTAPNPPARPAST